MSDPTARALESLLAFWADAGVDLAYADEPVDRTAEVVQALRAPSGSPLRMPSAIAQPARAPAAAPAPEPAFDLSAARALAEGAQSLTELEAAIAAYDGCPLKTLGAARAVFARGAPDAPVMIIGEGPGADEDAQGLPFVGRAGKLLDKMIVAAGLTDRVFITNTVFWRPPANRTPTPVEQLACRPFLERAIALVNPKLLLLVGAPSTKSMLGLSEGILSLRGRWFEWTSTDGSLSIPALPTLHPAFLLRQPGAKKKAWEDLLTLTGRLDRPERSS